MSQLAEDADPGRHENPHAAIELHLDITAGTGDSSARPVAVRELFCHGFKTEMEIKLQAEGFKRVAKSNILL